MIRTIILILILNSFAPCSVGQEVVSESVSLKEYFDSRIESINESTTLARNAMEKRLEGMNEFRDALKDQTNKFVTRQEMTDSMLRISEDIRILRESKATIEGKASQNAMIATLIVAVGGLIVGTVSLFKKKT